MGTKPRVPPEAGGIQVNTCHNPLCPQYGRHPQNNSDGKKIRDGFRVVGTGGGQKALHCAACGRYNRLRSNQAICEELERLWAPHVPPLGPACKNNDCENRHHPLRLHPYEYAGFGTNSSGSRRYRCNRCHKVFSFSPKATLRQRHPEKNEAIFRALINKVPMRRICELVEVQPAVLYQRLGFFQKQCNRFARHAERPLIDGFDVGALNIAIDRQEHSMNWGSAMDRRNARITGVASADNHSGYVFGMHFDHDPSLDIFEVDLHAREIGDLDTYEPFRMYARLWLPSDQEPDQIVIAKNLPSMALPATGARVRRDYTMFAHFHFLKRLLPGARRIVFYMDHEAGIRSACVSAFHDDIKNGRVDAFLVKSAKDITIDEKRLSLSRRESQLAKLRRETPDQSDWLLARSMVEKEYEKVCKQEAILTRRWVSHPLPNMAEPVKSVCYLTDSGCWSSQEIANMMLWGSLHGVDRFFMKIRRRVSLLERPIHSPSSARTWLGGSPYNPEKVLQIASLFRVAHNYILTGKDKKTPAMRLGLAEKPYSIQDVLNFDED